MGDWIWVLITAAITFFGLAFINISTTEVQAPLVLNGYSTAESINEQFGTDENGHQSAAVANNPSETENPEKRDHLASAVVNSSVNSRMPLSPTSPLALVIGIALLAVGAIAFRVWNTHKRASTPVSSSAV